MSGSPVALADRRQLFHTKLIGLCIFGINRNVRVFHADRHVFTGDFDQRRDVCTVSGRRIEACVEVTKIDIGFKRILDLDDVL